MKNLLSKVLPEGKFWTDAWSLVEGCTPVSPGCANCWLAGINRRNLPNLTPGLIDPKTRHFNGKIVCREDRLHIPLRAKKPRVYAIWSDLFHEEIPVDFLNRAFDVMNRAKHHRFIIITKRPHRAMQYLASWPQWSPMNNVTIMITMEDQQRVQERWKAAPYLVGKGWRVGILAEPLLSPIAIDPSWLGMMSWLVTGGESGYGARPAHPDWFRSLRDQAVAAGTPFLFKSWGEWSTTEAEPVRGENVGGGVFLCHDGKLGCQGDWWDGKAQAMDKIGKKKAGRTLDGRYWLEVPGCE